MFSSNVEVRICRSFSIRGNDFYHTSVTKLFVDMYEKINRIGRGKFIHDELLEIKKRMATGTGSTTFSINDAERIINSFNSKSTPDLQIILKAPILEIVIKGVADKINYYRLVKGGLMNDSGPFILDLDEDMIVKMLLAIVSFRSFSARDISEISSMRFRKGEEIEVRKILETVYRTTFMRDTRGIKCDKRMVLTLSPRTFIIKEEVKKEDSENVKFLKVSISFLEIFRHFVLGLNQTPDLGTVVDVNTPQGVAIKDGLRMLLSIISDSVRMPEMVKKVEEIKKYQNDLLLELEVVDEDDEDIGELEEV